MLFACDMCRVLQSLDTVIDAEDPSAIFDETNRLNWPVSRKFAEWVSSIPVPTRTA